MVDIAERVLTFIVGLILVVGSVKFIINSLEAQRAALAGMAYGIFGFVLGMCLCVWAFTGPPG